MYDVESCGDDKVGDLMFEDGVWMPASLADLDPLQ